MTSNSEYITLDGKKYVLVDVPTDVPHPVSQPDPQGHLSTSHTREIQLITTSAEPVFGPADTPKIIPDTPPEVAIVIAAAAFEFPAWTPEVFTPEVSAPEPEPEVSAPEVSAPETPKPVPQTMYPNVFKVKSEGAVEIKPQPKIYANPTPVIKNSIKAIIFSIFFIL
jgi:hypothetical protein